MYALLRALLICSVLLTLPLTSSADYYKYLDENGRLTFVDDISKVPAQFRDNIKSISEKQEPVGVDDSSDQSKGSISSPLIGQETSENSARKNKSRQYQTAVDIRNNRVLVPVEVAMGSRVAKLSLLLDTGASATVFHRSSLARLDLPSGKGYKARVAGGGTVKSVKIKFRHISVGPFLEEGAYAMVIDQEGKELPFDGLLGMDFLKKHPYQIDFQNTVIHWQSPFDSPDFR